MKKFLTFVFVTACTVNVCAAEYAASNKVIQVVIPQPPGSGLSMVYHRIEDYARRQNITMIPVYKPGASGKIGIDYAKSQKNNGDTLLLSTISDLVETRQYNNFDGVSAITKTKLVLVASKKSQIKTISDIVSKEKNEPGKLTWGYMSSAQLALIEGVTRANNLNKNQIYKANFTSSVIPCIVNGDIDLAFILPAAVDNFADRLTVVTLDNVTEGQLKLKENVTALFLPKNSSIEANKFWNNFTRGLLNDVKFKMILEADGIRDTDLPQKDLNQIISDWKM